MDNPNCTGSIELGSEIGSFSEANIHIYLEDVSRTGGDAKIVDKLTLNNASHQIGMESSFEFKLGSGQINPKSHYTIRVHIDLQRAGQVQCGDYVTVQSYPVLTFGHHEHVTIHVKKIL